MANLLRMYKLHQYARDEKSIWVGLDNLKSIVNLVEIRWIDVRVPGSS